MLFTAKDIENKDEALTFAMALAIYGYVAADPDKFNETYLWRGFGKQKAGRKRRYRLHYSDQKKNIHAWSEQEAVELARKWIKDNEMSQLSK